MTIRGTRVPETSGRSRGAPPPVRYDTQHAWPGIYGVFDARCCTCTWAYGPNGSPYQVKYTDAMCRGDHRRRLD